MRSCRCIGLVLFVFLGGCPAFSGADDPDAAAPAEDGCAEQTFYSDVDGDGFGDPGAPVVTCDATIPPGAVVNMLDCDDGDARVQPGTTEICDGKDTDCNGTIDDGYCVTGCADGEREGFVDAAIYPDIAGCSGAWGLPGLIDDVQRACPGPFGDDDTTQAIEACAAVDLCVEGWHICATTEEGDAATGGLGCGDVTMAGDPSLFFAIARSGSGGATCNGAGANDIFGCGNVGAGTGGCGLYNRFSQDLCSNLPRPPWSCGGNGFQEATAVTKSADEAGGVLCCRGL